MVFCLWAAALVLSILAGMLAPVLRSDGSIGSDQITALLPSIVGVYVPALSCLAGFWFPKDERTSASKRALGKERGVIAVGLTAAYLLIVLLLLFWPVYVEAYPATLTVVPGTDLMSRVGGNLSIATMLSPLALAPIHYLTSAP